MKWIIGWKFEGMYKFLKFGDESFTSRKTAKDRIAELKLDPQNKNTIFKEASDKHGNLKSW